MTFAKAQPEHRGGIAILGYCFGGLFAFFGATRLGADAGIAFHGTKIGEYLAEADSAKVPLSLHFGESDDSVPMTEVDAIRAALRSKSEAKIYTYKGAKHGFTQTDAPSYDSAAAVHAKNRAISLLETLK
jgi:carboxymethylenebutenolidase